MEFNIVGFGIIAVDDYLWVSSFPKPDRKALILEKQRYFGGLIGTALAAAAHLGMTCAYGGIIGNDDLSHALAEEFQRHNVDTAKAFVTREGAPVHSIIVADKTNHTRNIFFTSRAEPELPEAPRASLISDAEAVLVDQSGLAEAEMGKKTGLPVIGDLEWTDRDDIDRYLQAVDHLILPENAGRAITGIKNPGKALTELHAIHPREATVITSGELGCRFIEGENSREVKIQKAFPVDSEETNGCGDVFHGAYAAALILKKSVPEAIRFASAAAAVYASRKNGWDYLPAFNDVNRLL